MGWRITADDLDAGIALAQVKGELHQRSLVAPPVEVEALAGLGRAGAGARHQLRSVYAARQRVPERVDRPNQRSAVRHAERGTQQRRPQLRVLGRSHHGMDAADADVAPAWARSEG